MASLGIPEKNTVALMPTMVAGQKVNCIVLDDKCGYSEFTKIAAPKGIDIGPLDGADRHRQLEVHPLTRPFSDAVARRR